jgi:hypothetical protein
VVLSSPSSVPEFLPQSPPPQLLTLGWALRRAALWLLMLFVMVVVLGWLFYAGIDPDEASAGPSAAAEQAQPRN